MALQEANHSFNTAPPSPDLALVSPTIPHSLGEEFLVPQELAGAASIVTDNISVLSGKERIAQTDVKWHLWTPKDSADLITQTPVAILEGYLGPEKAYIDLAKSFARRGIPAVTHAQPRSQDLLTGYLPKYYLHPTRLAAQGGWAAMRGVMADERVQDAYGDINEFVLFAHSWGGAKAKNIVTHHEEHVAAVVLGGSVGCYPHNTVGLAQELGDFATKEGAPAIRRLAKLALPEAQHIFRSPGLTTREAIAASNAKVIEGLEEAAAKGIDVSMMLWDEDELMNARKSAEYSRNYVAADKIRIIIGLNHLAPQLFPDVVAEHAIDMAGAHLVSHNLALER